MRTFKTVTEPARERRVIDQLSCDLCGRVSRGVYDNWADGYYEVNETEVAVKRRVGTEYPDGSNIEHLTFDICPDCFEHKLVPWLESQGAKPRRWAVD